MNDEVFVRIYFVPRIKPDTMREYKEVQDRVLVLRKLVGLPQRKDMHEPPSRPTHPPRGNNMRQQSAKLCSVTASGDGIQKPKMGRTGALGEGSREALALEVGLAGGGAEPGDAVETG